MDKDKLFGYALSYQTAYQTWRRAVLDSEGTEIAPFEATAYKHKEQCRARLIDYIECTARDGGEE